MRAAESEAATEVDPATVGAIVEALRAVAKALRANQLYLPNNPTRQRATEVAQSLFAAVWQHTDVVSLSVRETELHWNETVVYSDTERGTDALPFLLYRDGLRELQFTPGFELDELPLFLVQLQRAKAASRDEDDLVTLLWVADFSFLRYQHVEVGSEVDLPVMMTGGSGIATFTSGGPQLAVPAAETAMPGDGPPPGIVRIEDFDSTLYFLEPRELAYLKDEVRRAYDNDGKRDVIAILLDIVEQETLQEAPAEVLRILETWVLELIANAEYEEVAFLLREARETAQRAPGLSLHVKQSLAALSARLSEPAVMGQLLQSLDESPRAPSAQTLELLFGELHASSMPTLLAWLATSQTSPVRAAVERAATQLASSNTAELVRLLDHDDINVVRGALRLASRLKSPAAVPGLGKLLRSPDAAIRTEAVIALGEIASTGAMQTLERAVDDTERETRVAAFRAIAANRYSSALPRLATALRKKELRQSDLTEKVALFEAYGLLCGENGVTMLDGVLNGRSLFTFSEPTEMRACAARALGLVGSPTAMTSLQKSVDTKDVIVRKEVQRALQVNS